MKLGRLEAENCYSVVQYGRNQSKDIWKCLLVYVCCKARSGVHVLQSKNLCMCVVEQGLVGTDRSP